MGSHFMRRHESHDKIGILSQTVMAAKCDCYTVYLMMMYQFCSIKTFGLFNQ